MNVTVKLPDELCRQARHRAVDESKSLSAWLADVVQKELQSAKVKPTKTLAEALTLDKAPDWFFAKDLPLEDRQAGNVREVSFEQ